MFPIACFPHELYKINNIVVLLLLYFFFLMRFYISAQYINSNCDGEKKTRDSQAGSQK